MFSDSIVHSSKPGQCRHCDIVSTQFCKLEAHNNKQMRKSGLFFLLYSDGDPDHVQNLMGSKLHLSSDFCIKI